MSASATSDHGLIKYLRQQKPEKGPEQEEEPRRGIIVEGQGTAQHVLLAGRRSLKI